MLNSIFKSTSVQERRELFIKKWKEYIERAENRDMPSGGDNNV